MPEKFPSSEGGDFLKEKYSDLPNSPEVESAVKRHQVRTSEKPKNKEEKIEVYLDRLQEIFEHPEEEKRERRVDILKDKLHDKFVIKPEEVPESYFNLQKRIAREQGHGDIEITEEMRKQMTNIIVGDQEKSLDAWVDYFGSQDATYPNWLKYFAFRSVVGLSSYDKEKKQFKKRTKGTTAVFPDINREALAYVLDTLEKENDKKKTNKKIEKAQAETTDQEWLKLAERANFAKMYAHAIEKITPTSEEEKEQIQGEWIKYDQGSDHKPLYESLQGHGTGWCTAGEGVAKAQLETGDFYVFYSKDKKANNTIPRVAIRMQESEIEEVRGINQDQNIESSMVDVAKEKIKELPGAEKYEKKVSDMKRLTEIDKKFINTLKIKKEIENLKDILTMCEGDQVLWCKNKIQEAENELVQKQAENQQVDLIKEELSFLYEIKGQIDGFGYQKDPRIKELQDTRNKRKDYSVIFDCKEEQVALIIEELNDQSLIFVGDLNFKDIINIPQNLKHIGGDADFKNSLIKKLDQLQTIGGNAYFRESKVEFLDQLKSIGGCAKFENSQIKELGQLQTIGGFADFGDSQIKELGQLQTIGGDADFENSQIKELGQLQTIGGDVYFRGSKVESLGQLQTIEGIVHIYSSSKLDFSKIKHGKVHREHE